MSSDFENDHQVAGHTDRIEVQVCKYNWHLTIDRSSPMITLAQQNVTISQLLPIG